MQSLRSADVEGPSLSLRRAWIEIGPDGAAHGGTSRSPYGERGLKSDDVAHVGSLLGRSPYGERGLK